MIMKKLMLIIIAAVAMSACSPRYYGTTTTYTVPDPIYMNDEADGSITVRAFGQGRNLADARAQAKKNALRTLIFKGISVPGNAYLSRPLVTEVNAQEKYESFFNEFFRDNGTYRKFCSEKDRKILSDRDDVGRAQSRKEITVLVKRAELKAYLIENGIIKTE